MRIVVIVEYKMLIDGSDDEVVRMMIGFTVADVRMMELLHEKDRIFDDFRKEKLMIIHYI